MLAIIHIKKKTCVGQTEHCLEYLRLDLSWGNISFQPLIGSARTVSQLFLSAVTLTDVTLGVAPWGRGTWAEGLRPGPHCPSLFRVAFLTGSVFGSFFDRVWWGKWRWSLGQVRVGRALHASAVKHRALSLQLQVSPADSAFDVLGSCCQSHTHRGRGWSPKQKAHQQAAASLLVPPCCPEGWGWGGWGVG